MADLTLRLVKGSPLTNEELDANFSNLNEGQTIAGEPMGHEDKTQSVLSFNASTRTVTVAPAGSEFVVWCKGEKYVFTAAQTVVIPNTTGIHYVYFSDAGVLSSKLDYFDWHQDAPTAYVYWNATTGAAPFFADERHGITLDWQTHEYLHRTRGAALANGFSIGNYTVAGDGSLDAHAQLDIAGGTFFDEDLKVQIVSTNTPTANTWEQDLAGPARIPVMYRSGDAWVIDSPTNFILKAGTATPRYNSVSGDVWGLTDTPNNSYSSVWVVATNNLTYPVIAIMGQAADNNSGDIEALEWSSLNLDGFPAVEFRPLYKVIFKAASGAANTVKAYFTAVFDVRGLVSAGPSATIGSSHGGLSGLGNDDHTQYLHVSEVRSPSAAVLASFLPAQTGNSGKFLTTNGTASSWATMTAPNNGTLTLATSGSGISGSASFTADQATGSTFTVTLNSATANSNNTIVLRDGSGNFAANAITANTFTGALSGNASTASTLATARSITASGDLAWTVSFDGSAAVSAAATLAASGVIAGAYGSAEQTLTATVDAKGRVTAMSAVTSTPAFSSVTGKPTTLAGYGITDAQGLDADLTAIAALAGTSGFLKKTAANSWTLDTSTYITGITSSMVTTALGFTPYNSSNPSGFITSSALSSYLPLSGGTITGNIIAANNNVGGVFGNLEIGYSGRYNTLQTKTNADTLWLQYSHAGPVGIAYGGGATTAYGTFNSVGAITQNGNQVLHAGNYTSYRGTQLVSPNGGTVVAADSAMPDSGHSFIHTLGLGPSGNDGHILGMTWASTTSVYGAQIWVDTDPNNRMAFRSRSSTGIWTGWNEVIHSSNYTSYSPSVTGSGASGTWGISISGRGYPRRSDGGDLNFYWSGQSGQPNWLWGGSDGVNMYVYNPSNFSVNYATSAGSASSAGYASYLPTAYIGGQQLNPQTYFNNGVGLKVAMTAAAGYWSDTLWINGYAGGDVLQMCALHFQRNGTPRMYISNQASTATSYGTLYEVLTGYNYSSYALPLSGGTVTGPTYFAVNQGGYCGSLSSPALQAYSSSNNSAYMSFHKGGHYAVNMGLDADNVLRIGGWSASANRWQLDMSGNGTYAGNVTAYSDESLKKDWAPLAADFIERLAQTKSGTYTRIDSGERQAGSSAQDWQKLLPEVVQVGSDEAKTLALAYGNAALVSAVELAKRVVDQEARIKRLESLINKLIGE